MGWDLGLVYHISDDMVWDLNGISYGMVYMGYLIPLYDDYNVELSACSHSLRWNDLIESNDHDSEWSHSHASHGCGLMNSHCSLGSIRDSQQDSAWSHSNIRFAIPACLPAVMTVFHLSRSRDGAGKYSLFSYN